MGGVEQQKLSVLVVGSLKSPGQWGLPLGDLGGRVRLGVFQLLMASCFLAHGLLAQSFTGHSQYLFTWPSPGAGLCLCPKDTSPTGLQATLMTSSHVITSAETAHPSHVRPSTHLWGRQFSSSVNVQIS